jgi:hypothetical protein
MLIRDSLDVNSESKKNPEVKIEIQKDFEVVGKNIKSERV